MTPDTTIPCEACQGSGKNPRAHPSHNADCGACFGSGLSTAPYDQRRNGTTITIWEGENPTLPPGTEFHGPGKSVERVMLGWRQRGLIYLISWPNPDYRGD